VLRHNRILTTLQDIDSPGVRSYTVALCEGPEMVGVALESGQGRLLLPRLSGDALEALAKDRISWPLPLNQVRGPENAVRQFAALWKHTRGVAAARGMREQLYEVNALKEPHPCNGAARLALTHERDLLASWITAFSVDARLSPPEHPELYVDRWIAESRLLVWETDGPVSMAVISGRAAEIARIGSVFTPPRFRGRGYASACVHALSRHVLDSGRRCILSADLANPDSNRLYMALGYEKRWVIETQLFES